MAIVKIQKRVDPKILFGIILNPLESNLYKAIVDKKVANTILKESLGINPKRLITITEAVNSSGEELDILVIYDRILEKNNEIKFLGTLEVKDFNFHIYNFNRKEKVDVESMIGMNYEE